MKVELDLSSEQLRYLDNSLTELVKNLTEEQQITILNNYMQTQMENLIIKNKSTNYYSYFYSSSSSTTLTELGQHLVNGLQARIADAITDKILETEDIKKLMEDYTKQVIDNLPSTIMKSINSYVVDQIFLSKDRMQDILTQQSYELKDEIYSALHNRS